MKTGECEIESFVKKAEESADDESSETAGEDEADAREERIIATVSGTYVFASMEDYDLFETQIRDMGLEEKYIVTSNDVEIVRTASSKRARCI